MADEIIIPSSRVDQLPPLTAEDIVHFQDTSDPTMRLKPDDIIIDKFMCNYGASLSYWLPLALFDSFAIRSHERQKPC